MNQRQVEPAVSAVDRINDAESERWLEIFSIFIHDIESPIASVKYLLRLIAEGRFDPTSQNHQVLLNSSRVALERTETIIYDIMAVARSGKAGIPVNMSKLVPTAVIEEAIELVRGSAEERELTISFTNNSGDIAVKADPKLLKRVLDNLIFNAIRHTPKGGEISVYTEPGRDSVFIHVKDSGPGLGEIDTEELFEKFGQVRLRQNSNHRGVGLGLYFCKLAAIGMGGTVMADDHEKGGAVFSVLLKKVGD